MGYRKLLLLSNLISIFLVQVALDRLTDHKVAVEVSSLETIVVPKLKIAHRIVVALQQRSVQSLSAIRKMFSSSILEVAGKLDVSHHMLRLNNFLAVSNPRHIAIIPVLNLIITLTLFRYHYSLWTRLKSFEISSILLTQLLGLL